MKRRSLGNSARTAFGLIACIGLGATLVAACAPVDRDFTTGQGGAGGGTSACVVDTQRDCYSGPADTLEVGLCRSGIQVCLSDETGFGECGGEVVPQPENCLTPEDEACDGPNPVECPSLGHGWSKGAGGLGDDAIMAIAIDPSTQDIIAVGAFEQQIDFGGGPLASTGASDFFLARLDASGNHIWSKRFGDASQQIARDVALDAAGNIYVVGEVSGAIDFGDGAPQMSNGGSRDAFVAKFDPQGNVVWGKLFGDADSQDAQLVAVTPANQVIVAGSFYGTIKAGGTQLTSLGGNDGFVLKLDADGFESAIKQYGGPSFDEITDMAVDSQGFIAVAGTFSDNANFGLQGNYVSAGGRDAFIFKLNSLLDELWVQTWGDAMDQRALGIAMTSAGEIMVAGDFTGQFTLPSGTLHVAPTGSRAIYLYGASADGVELWSRSMGMLNSNAIRQRIAIDPQTQSLVTIGMFAGSVDFGGGELTSASLGTFIARFERNGDFVASRVLTATGFVFGFETAVSNEGAVYVCGGHQGPADFGDGTLPAADASDFQAMLLRLIP